MEDLAREERLRGRERIGQLFQEGATGASGKVLARALPNPDARVRVVAVAGKRLGNAVRRNRMRRLLRAAYRTQKERLPKGWDIALVAKAGLLEAPWLDVTRDVERAIGRAVSGCSGPRPPRRNR